jgi:hypothetical protein
VTSTPMQEYLRPLRETTGPVLEVVGDRELPDAHPNESRRRVLKDLARSLRPRFSASELAYVASAVEVEANLIRDTEEASGW